MQPTSPPAVSVIIPTFNRAWILRDAVDSVLAQTHKDFELIVVNDGSTDETAALLAAYGNRVSVLEQTNRGVSAARNAGVGASRGDLVAFLDSDDVWLPEKLAVQVDFFRRHPEILICQTEETWIRNGRRVNPKNRHKKPSGDIFEPSLALCLVSPSAVMMRRQLYEALGGFDEQLPACEDYDFWLRIGCRHPVALIDRPLIFKRGGHTDQLSRQPSLDRYRIAALDNLLEKTPLSERQQCAVQNMLVEKCDIYAAGCRKRGRNEEADAYEKRAARFRPSLNR